MLRTKAIAMSLGLIGLGLALVPAPAQAASIVTFTDHESFTESFSDESVICQTELYKVTVEGRTITHLTPDTDTGMFRFTDNFRGTATEVPLTGPVSPTPRPSSSSTWRRSAASGTAMCSLRWTPTSATTSPTATTGPRCGRLFHAHFTINANGDVTTEFFVNPTDC